MGMDLVGLKPTGDKGKYMRVSHGAWSVLVPVCLGVAPAICAPIKSWANDGDGLDNTHSLQLATVLATLPEDLHGFGPTVDQNMTGGRQLIRDFVDFLKDSGGFSIC
tara:strand:- start:2071 stop:2391 length:321 start_codon:yes stop_codon:yes gene_type:complete